MVVVGRNENRGRHSSVPLEGPNARRNFESKMDKKRKQVYDLHQ